MTKNPFADPKHPIDYNLTGEDVKLTERKPEAHPVIEVPQQSIVAASYKDLEFELKAPRKGNDKETFYFNQSLERLRKAGFQRHPLPHEAFVLILDGLEGKLTGNEQHVKEDMLKSYGEWLSLVFKREGNTLHCYEHPEKIVWVDKYDFSQMTFTSDKTFPVKGLKSEDYISIKDVAKKSPDLVTYLWSRPFDKLPDEIQKNAGILIPAENTAWPVGRDYVSRYYVSGYSYDWASRGVRSASAKISTRNKGSP